MARFRTFSELQPLEDGQDKGDEFDVYAFVLLLLVSEGKSNYQRFFLTCTDFTDCEDGIVNQHLLKNDEDWLLNPDSHGSVSRHQVVEMKVWWFRNAVKYLVERSRNLMGALDPTRSHLAREAEYLQECFRLGPNGIDKWNRGNPRHLRMSNNFDKNFCVIKATACLERDSKDGLSKVVAQKALLVNYEKELKEHPTEIKAFMARLREKLPPGLWQEPRALQIPLALRPSVEQTRQRQKELEAIIALHQAQRELALHQNNHNPTSNGNQTSDYSNMNLSSSFEEDSDLDDEDDNDQNIDPNHAAFSRIHAAKTILQSELVVATPFNLATLQNATMLAEYEEVVRGGPVADDIDFDEDMNLSSDDDSPQENHRNSGTFKPNDTQIVFESNPVKVDSISKLDPLVMGRLYTFPCELLGYVNDVELLLRPGYTSTDDIEIHDIQLWLVDPGFTTEGRIIPKDRILKATLIREMAVKFYGLDTPEELASHGREIDDQIKQNWQPGVVGQCTVKRTEIDGIPIWLFVSH